jgi:hypothetical protein
MSRWFIDYYYVVEEILARASEEKEISIELLERVLILCMYLQLHSARVPP